MAHNPLPALHRKIPSEEGYSLVELLVVMAIIVLLGTIAVPQLLKYLDGAKQDTARAQIESLSATLDLFKLDVGRYPTQEERLDVLVTRPAELAGWNGPYVKRKDMLLDPWKRIYRYKSPGEHGDYDLFSYGADDREGGEGSSKDVTSW
jgi:general secretion pathway protein G